MSSRAVLRPIDPGNAAYCPLCEEPVKFRARNKGRQVICNVYAEGRWNRVEHWHLACYEKGGEPYGAPQVREPLPSPMPRKKASNA